MSNQLAEALRRLIDASMVAMTDQELATGETLSAWEDANEALAAHEAAKPAEPVAGLHFRKKPVVIEAMQWDGSWDSFEAIKAKFPSMEVCATTLHPPSKTVYSWSVRTLEGSHQVSVGDWIIKGVKGEFYPCKPDIFAMTYDPAAPPVPEAAKPAEPVYYEFRPVSGDGDWRMVPVEPTEEMLQEVHMQVESHSFDNGFLYEVWDAMLAATPAPAPEAEPVKVVVERELVWIKRGGQSFALAYEAETDDERQWYAEQLRGALAGFTPDVKTEPAQAQQSRLLPCPFCGHVGLDFADGSTHRWGLASCAGCGATCGETRRAYPLDDKWHASAIKDWNTRAKPEAQHRPILGAADWAAQQKQEPRNG